MDFVEYLEQYVEENRQDNAWNVLMPKDAILDEFVVCAKEHIKAINPMGMITIENILVENSQFENHELTIPKVSANFKDSDITKCANGKCEMRDKCYRYTSEANPLWQSYSDFQPINGVCDGYWKHN